MKDYTEKTISKNESESIENITWEGVRKKLFENGYYFEGSFSIGNKSYYCESTLFFGKFYRVIMDKKGTIVRVWLLNN